MWLRSVYCSDTLHLQVVCFQRKASDFVNRYILNNDISNKLVYPPSILCLFMVICAPLYSTCIYRHTHTHACSVFLWSAFQSMFDIATEYTITLRQIFWHCMDRLYMLWNRSWPDYTCINTQLAPYTCMHICIHVYTCHCAIDCNTIGIIWRLSLGTGQAIKSCLTANSSSMLCTQVCGPKRALVFQECVCAIQYIANWLNEHTDPIQKVHTFW